MKKAAPWIVLLVVAGAVVAWYYYQQEPPEEHPSVVTLPVLEEATLEPEISYPVESISVAAEEPEPEPLPTLAQSDKPMIEALAGLVDSGLVESHFVSEQVISRIVATIDSLDSRQLAPLVLPIKPAAGKFQAAGDDSLTIHPENAQRYAPYVRIASMADTQQLVNMYVRYYPLFEEAYSGLGFGDAKFNDRLVEVIDHLLATPQPEGELILVKPEAVYLYEDPDLEALSAGQKLLLRSGSSNATVIMDKLQEIRSLLVPATLSLTE